MDHEANIKIITESEWSEGTVFLLTKWERVCKYRKKAHYSSARNFGWKNKLLSIPTILISTILGSLSFIHPSFMDQTVCSRRLSGRGLQTLSPSMSPTVECIWEKYNGELIETPPFCDNSIINFNNNFYKSSLSSVDELICDRNVNFVDNAMYHQFAMPDDITTESEAEAWCVEHDEGNGIFYQQWVDEQIICMVLEAPPETPILHGQHLFGGVCVNSGEVDNVSEIYIKQCGNDSPLLQTDKPTDPPTIICAPCLTCSPTSSSLECAPGCQDGWPGDGECDDLCDNFKCDYDGGDCVIPTLTPTEQPIFPQVSVPTPVPTKFPTPVPTNQPTISSTTSPTSSSATVLFPYIIGGFNMFIALISALHAFLKYDTLEDRHHQYSRHFSNLQVDLETVLAKPVSQRGNAGTMIERYKTKYAILINNAPDLSETLEKTCCGAEDSVPIAIEMT